MTFNSVMRYLLPRLLFFAAGALLILLARGWQFDFEERTFKPTGILDIRSTPRGATVYLNSDQRGQTPLNLTGLQPENYQLTIAKSGYYPWQDQITVQPELVSRVTEVVLFPIEPMTEFVGLPDHERVFQHPEEEKWLLWHVNDETGERAVEFVTFAGVSLWRTALPPDLPDESRLQVVFPHQDPNLALLAWRDEADSRWEEVILLDIRQKERIQLSSLIEPEQMAGLTSPFVFYPETRRLLLVDDTFSLAALDPVSGNLEQLVQFDDGLMPLFATPARFLGRPSLYYLAELSTETSQDIEVEGATDEAEEDTPNRYGLFWQEMPEGNEGNLADFSLSGLNDFVLSPDKASLYYQGLKSAGVVLHFSNEQRQTIGFEEMPAKTFGWSASSEQFLFLTEENQLAYFDEVREGVVSSYLPGEGEKPTQACWHPNNQHMFFLSQQDDQTSLKVIEKDGKNLLTLLTEDALTELGVRDVIEDLPIVCESEESILVPVWREEIVATEESEDAGQAEAALPNDEANEESQTDEPEQTEEETDAVEEVTTEQEPVIRRDYLRIRLV